MKDEKRRLRILSGDEKKLMNEVLPAPTRGTEPGSARQRTMDRMTSLLAIAAASATLQAKCGSDPGYGVVDPMPAPAACPDVAASIQATATWKQLDGGLGIEFKLSKPGRADAHYVEANRPVPSGATITSAVVKDGAMTIMLTPGSDKSPWVYLDVECSAGPSRVIASLTLGEPKAGASIAVQLSDSSR